MTLSIYHLTTSLSPSSGPRSKDSYPEATLKIAIIIIIIIIIMK